MWSSAQILQKSEIWAIHLHSPHRSGHEALAHEKVCGDAFEMFCISSETGEFFLFESLVTP